MTIPQSGGIIRARDELTVESVESEDRSRTKIALGASDDNLAFRVVALEKYKSA
jgi:hypothetical protein